MAKQSGSSARLGGAASAASDANRYQPFGKSPFRAFALAVALPAVLLYLGGAALVIYALSMMADEIDRLEQTRGVTVMHAALDSFLGGLSEAVADEGTWNEAYLNVVVAPNPAWMDSTWGSTARIGATYDDVMVTDQSGLISFGENNLGSISGNIAARYPAAAAMLAEIDTGITASGDAAVISHFATDGKSPAALAAISIHQSTPGEIAVPRQQRRILWIARHVTPALLQDIAVSYQIPLSELVTGIAPGDSAIDMTAPDGSIVGTVAWTPERPGEGAFRHALGIVGAVFAGLGVLVLLILALLRRSMVRRAKKIEAAFAERVGIATVSTAAIAHAATHEPGEDEIQHSAIKGITASDFIVEYQPIFDLRSETMIGVETLLRWTRPDKTILLQEDLSPADCDTLLERSGIIALRHATGELGPLLGVVLTLSVTAAQLQNSVFAEKIVGTLSATNFQSRRLQLAVDTAQLPPADEIAPYLAELRRVGVTLALANFTLGAGTTGYIRAGLVDRICLAPRMIAGIDTDPVRQKLVEATIEAARSVDFAITVPGIARKEEATKMLRLGCREFRGSLLASSMPVAALTSLILAPAKPQQVKQAS